MGDEEAFAVLVQRHGPGMHRYALRLVGGSDADAAEVTQDALVSAWQGLPTFAGTSSLKTWLFRIVHRRAADLLRVRKAVPVDDQAPLPPGAGHRGQRAAPGAGRGACWRRCRSVSTSLPWQQRAVWLLREPGGDEPTRRSRPR
ncbi:RNA polymerase sigma factor [Nocardioides sp. W3-2-3]|uniref:RNA polymerase sigma factor n=1 Tax=Nocardioides convexus TaxID=2712224 RepID=UPI002418A3BF|nr:RNA polymerase sigma factor [Nocardioides convexus]NHA00913.1 RNA polymerase sigma factor [Nocardioides convexus]